MSPKLPNYHSGPKGSNMELWVPAGCQHGVRILKKYATSIEQFAVIFVGCGAFGISGPSKMSVSCWRGGIFQKFTSFSPCLIRNRFLTDFCWILEQPDRTGHFQQQDWAGNFQQPDQTGPDWEFPTTGLAQTRNFQQLDRTGMRL